MIRHNAMSSANPLVIVVDDDAAVRNSLKFVLEIDGFAVVTYESAEELDRADDLNSCQCLIVDQDMPRMTGLELVVALRKRGAKSSVDSDQWTRDISVEHAGLRRWSTVIEKPFMGNRLVELIRSAIRARPN
jgi:FixJ family two-component response regulator